MENRNIIKNKKSVVLAVLICLLSIMLVSLLYVNNLSLAQSLAQPINPTTLFTSDKDLKPLNENIPSWAHDNFDKQLSGKGVKFNTEDKQTITYTKTIDLSKNSCQDTLLELLITPTKEGAQDFTRMIITLAEEGNETNYLKVVLSTRANNDGFPMISSALAQATGTNLAGLHNGTLNTSYGTFLSRSFCQNVTKSSHGATSVKKDGIISLYYDVNENAIYVSPHRYGQDNDTKILLRKFSKNDPQSNWGGFNNNKVKLSIQTLLEYTDSYKNTVVPKDFTVDANGENRYDAKQESVDKSMCKPSFMITKINNLSLNTDENGNLLSNGSIIMEDIAYGVKDKKYPIPVPYLNTINNGVEKIFDRPISVKDSNGNSMMLYSHDGKELTNNAIYQEGIYFIPNTSGEYFINFDGINYKKSIIVKESVGEMTFNIGGDYSSIKGKTLGVGKKITLYPATAQSELYYDKDFYKDAKLSIYFNGEKLSDYNNLSISQNMDFVIDREGTYKIEYNCDDYTLERSSCSFEFTADKNIVAFNVGNINDTYEKGYEFNLPQIEAVKNNQPIEFTTKLVMPDSSETNSFPVKLNKLGQYSLVIISSNDTNQKEEIQFSVKNTPSSLFDKADATLTNNYISPSYLKGHNGLLVTANKSYAYAQYKNKINISKNTKKDILFKGIVLSDGKGLTDFNELEISLTDIHNPKNVVKISSMQSMDNDDLSYYKAGAVGQTMAGYNYNSDKVLNTPQHGTTVGTDFYSKSNRSIEVYYDYEEKAVYAKNVIKKYKLQTEPMKICDLDDDNYVQPAFKGFTTGEVLLTVTVKGVSSSSAKFIVENVNGHSMSGNEIEDKKSPEIIIDEVDDNKVIKGQVNRKFPIFNSTAYDEVDGDISYNVATSVVFNDSEQVQLQNENGVDYFTPTKVGKYTIKYSICDSKGNNCEKNVDIDVVKRLDMLHYSALDIPNEIILGNTFIVPQGEVSGGSGIYDINVTLTNLTTEKDYDANKNHTILEQGVYQIKVEIIDYLGFTKKYYYHMKAKVSLNPIVSDLVLPEYMVIGKQYHLPLIAAKDYYSYIGKEKDCKNIDIKVFSGDKLIETIDYNSRMFTPSGEKLSKLRFEYTAHALLNNDYKTTTTSEVTLLSADNISDYFYSSDNSVICDDEKSKPVYYTEQDNASIKFINPVSAKGININFDIKKETIDNVTTVYNNFDSLDIYVTDSINPNQQVLLSVCKKPYNNGEEIPTTSILKVNNGVDIEVGASFYGNVAFKKFDIYIKNGNAVYFGANKLSVLNTYLNGEEFKGFSSGKVVYEFVFRGVSGKSGIVFSRLNNQNISNKNTDRVIPELSVLNRIEILREINDYIQVPPAIACDVLDCAVVPLVSVTAPDGKKIFDKVNAENPLFFEANMYGKYLVEYYAVDKSGNKAERSFNVIVVDHEKPNITLNGEIINAVKVDYQVTLPTATVTDNNSKELNYYITAYSPSGKSEYILENKFTAKEVGEYIIRYYAYDDDYNYSHLEYKIVVGK